MLEKKGLRLLDETVRASPIPRSRCQSASRKHQFSPTNTKLTHTSTKLTHISPRECDAHCQSVTDLHGDGMSASSASNRSCSLPAGGSYRSHVDCLLQSRAYALNDSIPSAPACLWEGTEPWWLKSAGAIEKRVAYSLLKGCAPPTCPSLMMQKLSTPLLSLVKRGMLPVVR